MSDFRFKLPDGEEGAYQEITIKEGGKRGEVVVDVVSKEDVSDLLDHNHNARNEGKIYLGEGTQTGMYKVGELSALKAYQLMQDGIFWDDKALRRWLNDLDNYLWRTVDRSKRNAVQNTQAGRGSKEPHLRVPPTERGVLPRGGDDLREPPTAAAPE